MAPRCLEIFLIFLGWVHLITASNLGVSTLYLDQRGTVFSLNVAEDSNDTYFHLESPAHQAWIAFGAGDHMKNALMFMIYPSKDNKQVTLSPRIAPGDVEPVYSKDLQVEVLNGSSIENNTINLNAVCHNCRSWNGGSIDVLSTSQPWMYAFGPNSNPTSSNSLTADLTQHDFYGKFTMDMVQATGSGGVPSTNAPLHQLGVSLVGNQYVKNADFVSVIHGYVMAVLVIFITPLFILHIASGARFRWFTCIFFVLVALVGLAFGFYDSTYYNRSKNFNAPHQIIGYVVLFGLLILATSRIIARKISPPNRLFRVFTIISTATGHTTWLIALINGFLGIKLADSKRYIFAIYGCCIIAMIAVTVPLVLLVRRRNSRQQSRRTNGVEFAQNLQRNS